MNRHEEKRTRLLEALRERGAGGVGLAKGTSNLFRDRTPGTRPRIDLSGFNEVVRVDVAGGRAEAEGMTKYSDLVEGTLAHGVMPCVVPQLKSITLGGAAAGVGIEASSFKYGLVHDTLLALDVLLADSSIVTCTPEHDHRTDPKRYFEDLEARCRAGDADFVDGTVFSGEEMYITLGRFADNAPYTSDYTFEHIYYRSIREKETDYLGTRDFIWRWDTDWFWCSKNLFAQNPLVRRLLGRERLNSTTYAKVMRWNSKWGFTRAFSRLAGKHPESVIQDVDIPVSRASEFLAFFLKEVGILPVWICPIGGYDPQAKFSLYPVDPRTLYVNFGFWDVVQDRVRREPGFYNRRIERKVAELGGVKSLYSDSYYPEDEFWRLYNRPAYEALKARYDPQGRFKNLYQKCVLRH